ncbi:hypothetical protein McPS_06780 [Marichromatium sp. PS1]
MRALTWARKGSRGAFAVMLVRVLSEWRGWIAGRRVGRRRADSGEGSGDTDLTIYGS